MSAAPRTERHAALQLATQMDERQGLHRVQDMHRVFYGNAFTRPPRRAPWPARLMRRATALPRQLLAFLAQRRLYR